MTEPEPNLDEDIDLRAAARWVQANVMLRSGHNPGVCGRVGRYELRRPIGSGAYGRVWKAWDPVLRRDVAIKMPIFADPSSTEAHLEEARACARVRHPNLVEIFDQGVEAGEVWMAMVMIEGEPLRSWMDGKHSRGERLRVLRGLAGALVALHQGGLVHGDVKPENIIVTPEGEAMLTDLGLARDREEARRSEVGTYGYIAPEQLFGEAPSMLSDQYAFAVTAIEVLRPLPYTRIERVLERSRSEEPGDRWPGMADVVRRLQGPKPSRVLAAMSSTVALALMVAAVVEAPQPRALPELPSVESSTPVLGLWEAALLSSQGESQLAYDRWATAGYLARFDMPLLAGLMSGALATSLFDGGSPLEAAWVAIGAAEGFEAAGSWERAAEARALASQAFEVSGGVYEAERQLRCAVVNRGGELCR